MAITKSAKKSIRSSTRKKVVNDRRKEAMKKVLKEFKSLVSKRNAEGAKTIVSKLYKAIDKAAKTGVIKKNAAARKKSRLIASLKKIS